MCGVLGLIAVGGWKLAGLQYKEIAEVSSWQDALNLAQHQRVSGWCSSGECGVMASG